MINIWDFVRLSLETNLFFGRILREHAIFLAAALPCKEIMLIEEANKLKDGATALLGDTLRLANDQVSPKSIAAHIYVTQNTFPAEQAVQKATGIRIDTSITLAEAMLRGGGTADPALANMVVALNQKALAFAEMAIRYKRYLIQHIGNCHLFTWLFPSMLEHIIREESLYRDMLLRLQKGLPPLDKSKASQIEGFWDHIMEEHALYIRNYLDPEEKALSKRANDFAGEFEHLGKETLAAKDNLPALRVLTRLNKEATISLRDFKMQGTELILACKIKSLINPLLADHTVREANYYIQLLQDLQKFL